MTYLSNKWVTLKSHDKWLMMINKSVDHHCQVLIIGIRIMRKASTPLYCRHKTKTLASVISKTSSTVLTADGSNPRMDLMRPSKTSGSIISYHFSLGNPPIFRIYPCKLIILNFIKLPLIWLCTLGSHIEVKMNGRSVWWHKSKGYSYFGNIIFVVFGMEEKETLYHQAP